MSMSTISSQDLNLLIIEDNELVERATRRRLTGKWRNLTFARRADDGLSEISTGNHDLVLTDWDCPGGGGANVVANCKLPVVIFTGNSSVTSDKAQVLPKTATIEDIISALISAYYNVNVQCQRS